MDSQGPVHARATTRKARPSDFGYPPPPPSRRRGPRRNLESPVEPVSRSRSGHGKPVRPALAGRVRRNLPTSPVRHRDLYPRPGGGGRSGAVDSSRPTERRGPSPHARCATGPRSRTSWRSTRRCATSRRKSACASTRSGRRDYLGVADRLNRAGLRRRFGPARVRDLRRGRRRADRGPARGARRARRDDAPHGPEPSVRPISAACSG